MHQSFRQDEPRLKRRAFNMVEISIALLILGVGLISILGVFPIAANANREAVGMNYGSNAAEEMLNFIASRGLDNWDVVQALPTSMPATTGLTNPLSGWRKRLPTGYANSGVWQFGGDASTDPRFRVVVDTKVNNTPVTAFDGIALVWRSSTHGYYYDSATSQWKAVTGSDVDTTAERGAQLNIEISWPATLPYAARTKAYYSLEVSR